MAREAGGNLTEAGVLNVAVVEGPLAEGAARHGLYDVIILQGAVQVLPAALLDQLAERGRIVCVFQEGALGQCRVGLRAHGTVSWRFAFNATAPVLPGFARQPEFHL
jgi:protein-L-isoaspartate(D-aspartate) O-methyltransferase